MCTGPLLLVLLVATGVARAEDPAAGTAPASPPLDPPAPVEPAPTPPPVPTPPPPEDDFHVDETVVVTGSRTEQKLSESVVPTEVVTRQQVEESGAQDAADVLETVPGVEVERSFRGAGVRMQGLDSEYVLILVDGKRVIGARDGVIDLSRIPVERIERIEVVKGAASALYGSDAIGGVINIITRAPEAPQSGEVTVSGGGRDSVGGGPLFDVSGVAGLHREKGSVGLNAGWHQSPSYDLDPSDDQTDGNAIQQLNLGLEGEFDPASSTALTAGASYTLQDTSGVDDTRGAVYDRRNLTEEGGAHLGAETLVGLTKIKGGVSGTFTRDQYLADQRGSDAMDTYEVTTEDLVQVDAQVDTWIKGGHLLSGGVEGSYGAMTSPRLSQDGDRLRLGVFAQDEWRLGSKQKFAIVPSARVDVDSWFGTHPTPRLALRYDPTEHTALRLSAGSGFRAPTFKEMFLRFENAGVGYVVDGNPDLRPETAWNVSGGAETSPIPGLRLHIDLFYNHLDDMITVGLVQESTSETPMDEYQYVNVSSALTRGGEVGVNWRYKKYLSVDLGYSYTDTQDLDLERPLDGRSPHRGTFTITGRHPAWGLSATARGELVGPATFFLDEEGGTDGVDTDPYLNLKARVEKSFWKGRLRTFVAVDNLLDAGDALYVHLDPRAIYGGITLTSTHDE